MAIAHPTPGEEADARRDMYALLRSAIRDDDDAIDAILDNAGERGVRFTATALLGLAADLAVRMTARSMAATPEDLAAVTGADHGALLALPEIFQAVDDNLARLQAQTISETSGPGASGT